MIQSTFKPWVVFTLLVLVLGGGASTSHAASQTTYTPSMSDYCVQPPFLAGYVPPQVLFTMGKDHKFYYPAYNDASDINGDGKLEIGYTHSFDYYGYFDSYKCYNYSSSSGRFEPYGDTTDKYCTGTNAGMWSGNFLNWATMSRADVIKLVIYGGYRTADNQGTNYDEISGEYIPQDGHIWGKEYYDGPIASGGNGLGDANKLYPTAVSAVNGDTGHNRTLMCVNGTTANGNNISQLKVIPDATKIKNSSGNYVTGLRAWNWVNVDGNTNICSDSAIDLNNDGQAESATLTNLAKYNVSVKVCDPNSGFINDATWETKHCKQYGSNYRSVGLMQLYGETANSAKVCSKDMYTSCTSDNTCSSIGKGQCVNAANMFFGMIAGSYQNPKAGGFIRKDVYSINEETNQTNGQFQTSASSGKGLLIKSIEQFKAQATYPLNTQWGNPIGEILYEGMRYWAGKGTATSAFVSGISNGSNGDNGNYSSQPSWDTPATLYPACSMRFNLVFSDVYNSFDDDQLPGSAFNSSFTGDLANLNVQTLANKIWSNENVNNSMASMVVGESGTTSGNSTSGRCDSKAVSGMGNVRGLCPAEGDLKGTYYPAAVALYGHNSMLANTSTPNVLTYVVAFTSNVPEIRVTTSTNTKQVLVMPYGKSVSNTSSYGWSCTTSNTTFGVSSVTDAAGNSVRNLSFSPKDSTSNCPTMATVGYHVLETEYDSSNNLKYVKFNTTFDDLGGGDYDLDVLAEYTVCAQGATNSNCPALTGDQVSVQVKRVYSSAGNPNGFGFTIAGTAKDSSGNDTAGAYMIVQHTSSPPSGSSWATYPLPDTSKSMIFNAAASTVTLPKPPLWYAAKYGGFKDTEGTGMPYTDATCGTSTPDHRCSEWDSTGSGNPDNYFLVTDPSQMEDQLRKALDSILARVASGTAASILNNSQGSGASLIQAVFFPRKDFDNGTSGYWIGELYNMWYYLDPFLQTTTIREDTNKDYKLNLKDDRIAQFYFDSSQNKTLVQLYSDANGDGTPDSASPDVVVDPDAISSLWKAGRTLWNRNPSSSYDPRLLYTHTDDTTLDIFNSNSLAKFTTLTSVYSPALQNKSTILSLLGMSDVTKTGKVIDYINGIDQSADSDGTRYRNRKISISNCGVTSSNLEPTSTDSCYRVWKLGDIVTSTPKVVSTVSQNSYNNVAPNGYNDQTYANFIKSSTYQNRGMVFVGGNDGMLHAFRLGVLNELSGRYDKAQFSYASNLADSTSNLGREEWSFIPKQALPYLPYLKDPAYCHIYYVDKSPSLVDASVIKPSSCSSANYWDCVKSTDGTTWKTVLVGGMGYGGAAKWNGDSTYTAPTNSVKTPIKGTSAATGVGYSSYFALDVTNPTTPKYLWEFPGATTAAGQLGFSTTGPAFVRIAGKVKASDGVTDTAAPDHTKNGRWFAVFASGPTGYIDTVQHAFLGQSDQQLRIFVVDLATGALVRTIDKFADNSALPANAFAGSLSTSVIDTDRANTASSGWYSDDAIYIGYTQKASDGTWTNGGVIRVLTKESSDPSTWAASSLISGIGPVTTSVAKLQDRAKKNLWLYFGTGRYFFKGDDGTGQRVLYGVKEPCYSTSSRGARFTLSSITGGTDNDLDPTCTDASPSGLVNQSGSDSTAPALTLGATDPGWYINLDGADSANSINAERVITDPIASAAGAVFFTTLKPSGDVCKFGGDTLIWAVRYDTGGVPPSAAMQGKALIQVSTGAFSQISLQSAFGSSSKRYNQRRLASAISGVPPVSQGLSLVTNPPPVKKFLHVREK